MYKKCVAGALGCDRSFRVIVEDVTVFVCCMMQASLRLIVVVCAAMLDTLSSLLTPVCHIEWYTATVASAPLSASLRRCVAVAVPRTHACGCVCSGLQAASASPSKSSGGIVEDGRAPRLDLNRRGGRRRVPLLALLLLLCAAAVRAQTPTFLSIYFDKGRTQNLDAPVRCCSCVLWCRCCCNIAGGARDVGPRVTAGVEV